MDLPTVCIVNPAAKSGFTRINETDFDPAIHTLFDVATGKPVEPALRSDGPTIAEFVAAGYLASNYPPAGYASRSTADEIAAAIAAQVAGGGAPVIEIPADWQSLHWKQRVALAEKLNGTAALVPDEGQTQADAADAVIAAEVARRAG